MQRACDLCGLAYEAKRATSRFCSPKHRTAWAKGRRPTSPIVPPPLVRDTLSWPKVSESLARELAELGVLDTYEAAIALGTAKQLDSGVIVGAAYTSLSKELDRRVDALRLRGERLDDPARAIQARLEQKRLRLIEGIG